MVPPTETSTALIHLATPWALVLDGAYLVIVFALKVLLLAVTVKAVSFGSADRTAKKCIYTTAFFGIVYIAANPTLQTYSLLRPYLVVALVGTLVCKRVFWIGIDKALLNCLMVCLLSIFIGDYSTRGMNRLDPERATINRSLAAVIDAHATHDPKKPAPGPSEDTLTAIVRASSSTTSGIAGSVLGFLRAGLEAKAEVERLQKLAAQEAALANLLAGGTTNVARNANDLAELSKFLNSGGSNNVPIAPVPLSTNETRHGYLETYKAAKATIEEANRVASNNAEIVNMLSGIGARVTDRKEEMDKLHAALLGEAERGGVDLSGAGPPMSDEQAAGLLTSLGGAGAATNTTVHDKASAVRAALNDIRNAGSVYAESVKALTGGGTNAVGPVVKLDKLHATLLQEAMRGNITLSTNGGLVTEKQLTLVRAAMGPAVAAPAKVAEDTNSIAGAAAKPADSLTAALVQSALDEIRRAAAAYGAIAKRKSDVQARSADLAITMEDSASMLFWNGPPNQRVYRPGAWIMRLSSFERVRQHYSAPWGGVLRSISKPMAEAQVAPLPTFSIGAAPRSEMAISVKPVQAGAKAAPPPPSPYELLSKEERAKWDAALQSIKVSGFVGKTTDVAAMVGGKLVRRGEIFVVDQAGGSFPFRLLGINKSGACSWEPLVDLSQKKVKASAAKAVTISL